MDIAGRTIDVCATVRPEISDLLQQLWKPGASVGAHRREIGSTEKRFEIGRQKDIQRPAAGARGGLDEGHVNLIHVRSLLAVDLYADEVLVEQPCDILIFK